MAHCKHWHNGSCKDCTKRCPIKAKLNRQYAKAQKAALQDALLLEGEMEVLSPLVSAVAPSPATLAEALAHGERVARLAGKMFAALAPVYGLGEPWDAVLHTAARLHDIGWAYGQKGHHKASARMIRKGSVEEVDAALRPLAALVARYHRRSEPSPRQKRFAALTSLERRGVRRMAALLRLADALDYSHQGLVQDVDAAMQEDALRLTLHCAQGCAAEMTRLEEKQSLFKKVFKKDVVWACKEQETAEVKAAPSAKAKAEATPPAGKPAAKAAAQTPTQTPTKTVAKTAANKPAATTPTTAANKPAARPKPETKGATAQAAPKAKPTASAKQPPAAKTKVTPATETAAPADMPSPATTSPSGTPNSPANTNSTDSTGTAQAAPTPATEAPTDTPKKS